MSMTFHLTDENGGTCFLRLNPEAGNGYVTFPSVGGHLPWAETSRVGTWAFGLSEEEQVLCTMGHAEKAAILVLEREPWGENGGDSYCRRIAGRWTSGRGIPDGTV